MKTSHSLVRSLALFIVGAAVVAGCKPEATGAGGSSENSSGSGGGSAAARPVPTAPGNTASGDTIKIGIVASLTGDQRPWGDDSVKGAEIAVKEFNDAGGVGGKKVVLLKEDSASKPEQAKSAAEKLISDGVIGIVGEVASGHTEQIARSAFEKGLPVVAIGATKTALSDIGSNFFRVCYTDDFQGPVMARFAYEERGMRKMAIITDNKAPYSQGLSKSFRAYFTKLGGEIVDEVFYETGQTQFSSQLTNLKAKNPQGIFMSGYFPEVGPMVSQARDAGITAEVFGGDGWDSTQILQSGGKAILGGFLCNHYNNKEDRPEVKAFLSKWKAAYGGEPGTTMGALGYDAAFVMLEALKRCETFDSKSLIDAIEQTENLACVSGSITLKGQKGNPPKRALVCVIKPLPDFQVYVKSYDYFAN